MFFPSLLSAAGLAVLFVSSASAATSVTITNGTVEGIKCAKSDVVSFLGIPFAKADRFAAPKTFDAKFDNGVFNATTNPVSCPQFSAASAGTSEDCLFLNVYAPPDATPSSKLPVKVFIYGGSNEGGSISQSIYTGCFAAVDSLLVAINYRIGPLGYLALPEANITGNFGMLDQLAGLQWVQDNIAAFGGDPSRVMLFGQSAGSLNAFVLSTLPQAPKLISAAAFESGAGRSLPTTAEALAWNQKFATQLGCSSSDLACLRGVSISAMRGAESAVENSILGNNLPTVSSLLQNGGKGATWGPVVDGTILPAQPVDVGAGVPSIFGSNTQDGSLFVLGLSGTSALKLSTDSYASFLKSNFGNLSDSVQTARPLSFFESRIPEYLKASSPTTAYYATVSVITAAKYMCPNRRALQKTAARGIPTYAYLFDHTPSCAWFSGMSNLKTLGPTHSAEIPFVFGLTRNLPPPSGSCNFTSTEDSISAFMRDAWTSMAGTGSPVNGSDSSEWPQWNANTSTGVTISETGISAGFLNYTDCDFWDSIDATINELEANGSVANSASTTGSAAKKNGAESLSVMPIVPFAAVLSAVVLSLLW